MKRRLLSLLLALGLMLSCATALASASVPGEGKGFEIIIRDAANLLSIEEKERVLRILVRM